MLNDAPFLVCGSTTKGQAQKRFFSKAIGNYIYNIENKGFGEYRILGKKPIESQKCDEQEETE